MDCEIVDGGCFATIYKYCRTHKGEPDKCPKSEEPAMSHGVGCIEAGYVVSEGLSNVFRSPNKYLSFGGGGGGTGLPKANKPPIKLANKKAWRLNDGGWYCVDFKTDFDYTVKRTDSSHPGCVDCFKVPYDGIYELSGVRGFLEITKVSS